MAHGVMIKSLRDLNETQINQAFDVFIEGFYSVFSSITRNKKKLHKILKSSVDFDVTYAYLENDVPIGFLCLRTHEKNPINPDEKVCREVLGKIYGKIVHRLTCYSLTKANPAAPGETYVDFLAVSSAHRSKGVGSALIEFAREHSDGDLLIEVFSKNPRAKELYERQGFKTLKEKSDIITFMQGWGKIITMKSHNPNEGVKGRAPCGGSGAEPPRPSKKSHNGSAYVLVIVAALVSLTLVLTVLTITAASRNITARYGDFYGLYDVGAVGNNRAIAALGIDDGEIFFENFSVAVECWHRYTPACLRRWWREWEFSVHFGTQADVFFAITTICDRGDNFYIETRVRKNAVDAPEVVVRTRVFLDDDTLEVLELFRIAN